MGVRRLLQNAELGLHHARVPSRDQCCRTTFIWTAEWADAVFPSCVARFCCTDPGAPKWTHRITKCRSFHHVTDTTTPTKNYNVPMQYLSRVAHHVHFLGASSGLRRQD